MRKLWPGCLALIAVLILGLAMLSRLPEQVATHWSLTGEADGWSSRTVAVLLLPGLGLVLAALLAAAPRIDPKRDNFPLHAGAWWLLANALLIFLAVLQLGVVAVGLGWIASLDRVLGFGVGALLMILGNYFTRVRANWFFGIRTPWTLSSDRSWRETHRIGGRLFLLGGLLLVVVTAVTGRLPAWAIIVGVFVPALIAAVVSYLVWRSDPDVQKRPS